MKSEGIRPEFFGAPPLFDPLLAPCNHVTYGGESLSRGDLTVHVPDVLPRLKPEVLSNNALSAEQVQAMIDRAHELAAQLEAGTLKLDRIDPRAAEDWTQAVYNLVQLDADAMPYNEYRGPHRGGIY